MNQHIFTTAEKYLNEYGWIPIPVRSKESKQYNQKGQETTSSRKAPLGYQWQKTTKETAMKKLMSEAKKWVAKTAEPINLGILTGRPSGIFVVDIDKQDSGLESWQQLTKGLDVKTLVANTPSGGHHYIFSYDDRLDIFNSTAKAVMINGNKVGIDFRSTGGQIVIAPSVYDHQSYTLDLSQPITRMPDTLFEVLKAHISEKVNKPKVDKPQINFDLNDKSINNSQSLFMDLFKESIYSHPAIVFDGLNKDGSVRLTATEPYDCVLCEKKHTKNQNHPFIFENESGIYYYCRTGRLIALKLHQTLQKIKINLIPALTPESLKELNALIMEASDCTSYNLARVVEHLFAGKFVSCSKKFCHWYTYQQHRWQLSNGAVHLINLMSTTVAHFFQRLIAEKEASLDALNPKQDALLIDKLENTIKGLKSAKKQLQNDASRKGIINDCQGLPGFYNPDFERDLDMKGHLLGFNNGIVDLNTGQLRSGQPEDMVSLTCGYDYITKDEYGSFNDDHPHIKAYLKMFVEILPEPEAFIYMLKLLASFLEGGNTGEKFYIWTGAGRNGKSNINNLEDLALGEYAQTCPVQLLTGKSSSAESAKPEVASLRGKRTASFGEASKDEPLNTAQIKLWSGNDTISCRHLYGDKFTYKPRFKMLMLCNPLPPVDPGDFAFWARTECLDFKQKFVEEPKLSFEHKVDTTLKAKLPTMKQAFMWSLVTYWYPLLKKEGNIAPACVKATTNIYREDNDYMKTFIDEHLEEQKGKKTKLIDIWDEYKKSESYKKTDQRKTLKSALISKGYVCVKQKQDIFTDMGFIAFD